MPQHDSNANRQEKGLKRLLGEDRTGALWMALLCILGSSAATRVALFAQNYGELSGSRLYMALAIPLGILFDLTVAAWAFFPFSVFLAAMPQHRLNRRGWYWGILSCFLALIFALLYLSVVEFYFFGEYNSRFNSVAVEYLNFPHEILSNVWASYPVLPVLAGVAIVTAILVLLIRRPLKRALATPATRRKRTAILTVQIAIMLLGTLALTPRSCRISNNRIVDEIAMNGFYAFFNAALTYDLDYDSDYAKLNDTIAFSRIRAMLKSDNVEFTHRADSLSIDRTVSPAGPPRKLNVVIILEESLGAIFVKSLTPNGPGVTPEFERLADSGLLFTHIYATGTRTVRGMEATLLSLPPIPGQSIIRRPEGEHIFALPSLLKQLGYQTEFIYAGYSYYDNMKNFMLDNGTDRVIDINDPVFKQKTYATLWGLCDEDLFDNSLEVLDSLQRQGKPFFTFMLTVSNHSPFGYPKGRIPENPDEAKRNNAVKYADFALGKFFRDARSHPFFDSTLFVVLGDHGPQVYGPEEIPMDSYRIPILFYGPHIVPAGVRDSVLGSQLDLAPTIMGVLNLPYSSQFFGDDLRKLPLDKGRALLSLNRDVGMYRRNHMVVLSVQRDEKLWARDPQTGRFSQLSSDQDIDEIDDAIAYYQTAFNLLRDHRLHPLPQPSGADGQGHLTTTANQSGGN